MRVPREQFRSLSLEVHGILSDVPLHDVTVVDLPGGGAGRTISDVRALLARENVRAANPIVRGLFALRALLGRLFGWDSGRHMHQETSSIHRLSSDIKRRSALPPGALDGPFRVLYVLERESLAEVRNATVHAFLASVLTETLCGYRLYWAVYRDPGGAVPAAHGDLRLSGLSISGRPVRQGRERSNLRRDEHAIHDHCEGE
jgi:hypothetical protein